MAYITLNADSTTVVLNGHICSSLAEGDQVVLTFDNDFTSHVNSANGGSTINKRSDHGVCTMTLRVQKFGDDDIFLNSAINTDEIAVFDGSVKESFNRDGSAGVESYILEQGTIVGKPANTKNSLEGNAMMEYSIRFRNAQRNL